MVKKSERIFISYKRVDTKRVDALRKSIEQATGETCWIDRDGIESDAQFVEVIMDAIDQCEIFLFMRSKAHNNITNHSTDWTIREVNYALGEKKRIVFINLDNAPLPRWFKFMFPQQQEIDASDTLSLEHFYADLCSWLKVEVRKETVLKGKKAEGEDILNILNSILVYKEKNERKREENLRKIGEQHTQTIKLSSAKKYIQTFNGHTDTVSSVEFSPDGSRIVSASWDNTVRIWDTETANNIKILKGKLSVDSASFIDSKKIVFASSDNAIRIWDIEFGECIGKITGHTSTVNSFSLSPYGSYVVTASDDHTIRVWNVLHDFSTGKIQTLIAHKTLYGHNNRINSAVFCHYANKRIASASDDHTIRIWDIETGKCIQTLYGTSRFNSVAFSYDGMKIVAASGNNIEIWHARMYKRIKTLVGHTDFVNSVAFNPNGSRIVTASDDKTIRIWNALTGECLQILKGHSSPTHSAGFSPDGKKIVYAYENTVRIWDISGF